MITDRWWLLLTDYTGVVINLPHSNPSVFVIVSHRIRSTLDNYSSLKARLFSENTKLSLRILTYLTASVKPLNYTADRPLAIESSKGPSDKKSRSRTEGYGADEWF